MEPTGVTPYHREHEHICYLEFQNYKKQNIFTTQSHCIAKDSETFKTFPPAVVNLEQGVVSFICMESQLPIL